MLTRACTALSVSILLALGSGQQLLGAPVDLAEKADAREVIRKMDLLLRGDSSFGAYRMTITDPDWERTPVFIVGTNNQF